MYYFDLRGRDTLYLNWCGFYDLTFPQMLYYTARYLHVLQQRTSEAGNEGR